MIDWTKTSTWVVILLLMVAVVGGIGLFFGPIGMTVGTGISTELLP
ncbi:MAG TPA: hypothetical protein VFQ81_00305 [Candidatus Limnocylindria bacterium]|nr:hypothetical protein [Candidatus Limnocylindria bacterium]